MSRRFISQGRSSRQQEDQAGSRSPTASVQNLMVFLLVLGWTVFADDPRWAQPDLQAFRQEFVQREEALQQRHQQARVTFLQQALQQMEELVRKANRTRNAREIMTAREGRTLIEQAIEQARAGKEPEWPEQVRPELDEQVKRWRTTLQELDQKQRVASDALRQQGATHFARQWSMMTKDPVPPETQTDLFTRFLEYDPTTPPPTAPPAATATPSAPIEQSAGEESPYFASNTTEQETNLLWTPIARWTGEMRGIDVVRINPFDRAHPEQIDQLNPMSQKTSALSFQPMANLPQRADYKFRLKRISDRDTVDVLEWPSTRNVWHLIVRTRRGTKLPHPTGFIMDAALPKADLGKLLAGAGRLIGEESDSGASGTPATINVRVESEPPTALIYLNDQPYMGPRGHVATPYVVAMPPGKNHLRLTRYYFQDWVLTNYVPSANAVIHANMTPREDMPWKRSDFKPQAGWVGSGLILQPGDTLFIKAEGRWQIGARRDYAGPDGYPKDKFPHYYDPADDRRLTTEAPYGALLMRIGPYGSTNHYASQVMWRAPPFVAEVYLNVNEVEDPKDRRDNQGKINLRTAIVTPLTFE